MSNPKTPYWQKLTDPRWQKLRLTIFNRDRFQCRKCRDKTKTLEVHHQYYISGREPWEYPEGCFLTLCSTCHSEEKQASRNLRDWEILIGLTNDLEAMACCETQTLLGESIIAFAHLNQEPDVEVYLTLTDALDKGLITKGMLLNWRGVVQ